MTGHQKQQGDRFAPPNAKTFRFGFSLGKAPPEDDPAVQALIAEARARAAASPGGAGKAERQVGHLEFSDGVLRIGGPSGNHLELDLSPDDNSWPPGGTRTALDTMRTWLHKGVRLVAVALPVSFLALGVATGQTFETTFYMTVFGLLISMMFVSSFLPSRTWFSRVLEDLLRDAARKRIAQDQATRAAAASTPLKEARPFTITCRNCNAAFTPVPPRAVCPHCSTPALSA